MAALLPPTLPPLARVSVRVSGVIPAPVADVWKQVCAAVPGCSVPQQVGCGREGKRSLRLAREAQEMIVQGWAVSGAVLSHLGRGNPLRTQQDAQYSRVTRSRLPRPLSHAARHGACMYVSYVTDGDNRWRLGVSRAVCGILQLFPCPREGCHGVLSVASMVPLTLCSRCSGVVLELPELPGWPSQRLLLSILFHRIQSLLQRGRMASQHWGPFEQQYSFYALVFNPHGAVPAGSGLWERVRVDGTCGHGAHHLLVAGAACSRHCIPAFP